MAISVTLTSANMGDVDECDFDAWASFVCDSIDDAVGFEVAAVDMHAFGRGPGRDTVSGASEEQEAAIREYLSVTGWDAWCSSGGSAH